MLDDLLRGETLPSVPLHRSVYQGILHAGLRSHPMDDRHIGGIAGNQVDPVHRTVVSGLRLPHRADALEDLLVEFEVPPLVEVADDVAAILKVQTVPCTLRVRRKDRYLATVPCVLGGLLVIENSQTFAEVCLQSNQRRLPPIRQQDRHLR